MDVTGSARVILLLMSVVHLSCNSSRMARRTAPGAYQGFRDVHPSLLVTNPRVLESLEAERFSFADVLGARKKKTGALNYAQESANTLLRSPLYGDLVSAIEQDMQDLQRSVPGMGIGMPFVYRIFDVRWLRSERVHFELVGLVNRMDFRHLKPPGCGQTRLVYRLALRPANRPTTRLPMTVNVIYENRQTDCSKLARAWLSVEEGLDIAEHLRKGPLATLDLGRVDRIEIDIQSLRQNAVGPSSDDHAEYILRGFNVADDRLEPDPVRNTPPPNLPENLKEELWIWIRANLDVIEEGAIELPGQFLAASAVSLAPRGLNRLGNRPFKAAFPEESAVFSDLDLSGRQVISSPQMLVRRLDELTCVGCHQARSIAGFHLLGEERTDRRFDAMTLGISEHLRTVLGWRFEFLRAAAAGRPFDKPVPLAEHADRDGDYGAHCVPEDTRETGLPAWSCHRGLACQASTVDGDPFGLCLPNPEGQIGDPCERVGVTYTPGPNGDTVKPQTRIGCASLATAAAGFSRGQCRLNRKGFPGGMCTVSCPKEGEIVEGAVCARIPHFGFEGECFKEDAIIERCLTQPGNSAIELVRACSRTTPCRDDYVCARMPSLPLDQGACVPPYFLFQTRVDGPPMDRL